MEPTESTHFHPSWFGPGSRREWLARLGCGALAASGLGGCAPGAPLRVGVHPWIGYGPLRMAQTLNWLPPGVELHTSADGLDTQKALLQGELQGGALTLDELLRLRSEGLDAVVLLVFDVSAGADKVLARQPLDALSRIRGQRIGVEMGGVGAVMLHGLLSAAGLRVGDVTLVDHPASEHARIWAEQRVDVLITYEPIASTLVKAGAHVVSDSRHLPDTIFDVLVATRKSVFTHREGWAALVNAHFKALQHLRTNPQDAVYRIATLQQQTPADVLAALRGVELPDVRSNLSFVQGETPRLQKVANQLAQLMLRHGLLAHAVPTDDLCDPRFVAAARLAQP